ncbi:hypothetical protein BDQ17DRAFT_775370 [Cyathus striatus]|nr:hypothetical protein BDQ17DRAFT_775370 [Cyathus striatus]
MHQLGVTMARYVRGAEFHSTTECAQSNWSHFTDERHPPTNLHIAHILSIYPDFQSTAPRHLPYNTYQPHQMRGSIDSSKLLKASELIKKAIEDEGERGVSALRYGCATVVLVFLMCIIFRTTLLSLRTLQKKRPQVHSNCETRLKGAGTSLPHGIQPTMREGGIRWM